MIRRSRGELVRSLKGEHGIVEKNFGNTAMVLFENAPRPRLVSIWALKNGNEETARRMVAGAKGEAAGLEGLARIVNARRHV